MPQSRRNRREILHGPDICRDQIEQKIIRAYVQLAVAQDCNDGFRIVMLARFGGLEVRLTKTPQAGAPPSLPSYWLEIYSRKSGSTIDRFECLEFDEGELAAAVEFVCRAKQRHQALN
ncbi:hypothetical protein [Microvirga brassicacearum]|uniref:Uncharacterized protein n=1 Tax=Microvirga brassicacearum TaxID=2580413 RepID=A0A5N3P7X4_9HYPH|nr:hypothetical protein [Microvirga brassicacearum]KAB0265751.1 hypothetical protein FEZ63_17215 [Microvirga brassicacearum]